MKIKLEQLAWHDSEIQSIFIDRSEPGKIDELLLRIRCPESSTYKVLFKDCYRVNINLNMGIVSSENILDVFYKDISKKQELLKKLSVMDLNEEKLRYFRIETGSTGGLIELFYFDSEVTKEA